MTNIVYADERVVVVESVLERVTVRDARDPPGPLSRTCTVPTRTTCRRSAGRCQVSPLAALRSHLGDVAYNLLFHSTTYRVSGDYCTGTCTSCRR